MKQHLIAAIVLCLIVFRFGRLAYRVSTGTPFDERPLTEEDLKEAGRRNQVMLSGAVY